MTLNRTEESAPKSGFLLHRFIFTQISPKSQLIYMNYNWDGTQFNSLESRRYENVVGRSELCCLMFWSCSH